MSTIELPTIESTNAFRNNLSDLFTFSVVFVYSIMENYILT